MTKALGPVSLAVLAFYVAVPAQAAPQGVVPLASHRAVYDLKLTETRGKRPIQAVRGRILYDFSGSPCEGYALQFRQVSELDNGEGKASVSDLRATTWEDGTGKRLRFFSENYLDSQLRDVVDGEAERLRNRVGVKLTKPADKNVELEIEPMFPTEHVRHIIAAARDGKRLLESVVYDGSESGEKLYDTLTIIGTAILPEGKKPDDAAVGQAALAQVTRWPVTISYFDRSKQGGEQVPVYAITLELYENGVSRALKLDYGDFVLSGEMTQIEFRDVKACQ
jgi:hypothetical protein